MGGIGKTTLARVAYTQMSPYFEGKSFLADVREVSEKYGLVSLQKQLLSQILLEEGFNLFNVHEGIAMISHRLSHKKVLIVIDDADNIQHLKYLVGRLDWFGLGSKIIVTTRDEHLLRSYQVNDIYKPTTLDDNEALSLFNLKAFGSDTVQENHFVELSKQVVEYANGLPLALEILGSFLCGRDASQWRSAIERLKRDSKEEIHDRLKVSFDGLEETEKNIFLDIACFFNGEEKDFVINVLDGCDFFSNIGIDVLTKKCLIKVDEGNKLWMHDLLQEMGRKIVRQKSPDEPGKRCRLWEEKDVNHVLTQNTASEVIEGMVIDIKREQNNMCTSCANAFLKMKNLRLLRVFHLKSSRDLKYLSNEVRLLEWHGYPFKSLPSSFQLDNLVALILPYSSIKHLWKGNRSLYKLKLINLKGSQNLIRTPEFTMAPNLESLILEGCSRIVDVHPSIGVLSNLVLLNLKDCSNLVNLPSSIDGCKCLKALNLSGCSKLEILPDNLQHVEFLEELDLGVTAIRKPPSFIFQFKMLKVLSFCGCKGPPSKLRPYLDSLFKVLQRRSTNSMPLMLPPLLGLSSLKRLNLSDCNLGQEAIPSDICSLSFLEELDLSGNDFIYLPATLSRLSRLQCLHLSDCKKLKSLPVLQSSTEYVLIDNCKSLKVAADPITASNALCWAFIGGINCYKLTEKNNVITMLKKYIKIIDNNARGIFDVFMPGSEIPNWFRHQRDESLITIPLPRNIQNDSEWMGIAFCCVFFTAFKDDNAWEKGEEIMCKAAIHNGRNSRKVNNSGYTFAKIYRPPQVIKDHLWLRYWSRGNIFPTFLHDKCENLLSLNFEYEESDDIFESSIRCGVSYKVKKCGIRLLYEKDLEKMEEIKEQCRSATSAANFDDNGLTGKGNAFLKPKRSIYEEEARSSEIIFLFDIAEETPQPKRLQKIINIEKENRY
ncbi:hypothetical protein DITRI_Ditri16bG0132900 [Diplodiscus trichospermus]